MASIDSKKVSKMMREYFNGDMTASEVATKYHVPMSRIYTYAKQLELLGVSRQFVVKRSRVKGNWHTIAQRVTKYVEKKHGRRTIRRKA